MTCRSCSADIDDKAIVCYRCGAPTADAAASGRARAPAGRRWLWPVAIAVVALAVAAYFLFVTPAG